MKSSPASNQALYGPMQHKTFAGALSAFFAEECPSIGGTRTRDILVRSIIEIVDKFHPETTNLKSGQIHWATVDKSATSSYGKRISQTPMTSVILDLVKSDDIADRIAGKPLRELKRDAVARLCLQADSQGGCLTLSELGILLKIAPATASIYAKQWEATNGSLLPRRGTIHDMGPTLTHKSEICRKLFLEGKSVEQVCRETCHSPGAVNRYITDFKRVLQCRLKGLSVEETAFAVKMSKPLVEQYHNLFAEYAQHNPKLEELLNHHPKL